MSASPLFRHPPELREVIYEHLLVQEGVNSIAKGLFRRHGYSRDGSHPVGCYDCCMLFSNRSEQARHAENNDDDIPSLRYINLPTPPSIEISILLTCRLTHYEALPVIYAKIPFCFSDPSTLDIFHWTHNAVLVREIVTQLISLSGTHFNAWRSYITKKLFNLARDFPNLKRMVLVLDSERLWNDAVRLRPCNIQRLD